MKEKISEKIEDQFEYFVNGIGQGIQIQLINEETDPVMQEAGCLDQWTIQIFVEYAADFTTSFDLLGLFFLPIFTAQSSTWLKSSFMVLMVTLYSSMPILGHTPARTIPESRIIFKNQVGIPSQTPHGIKDFAR